MYLSLSLVSVVSTLNCLQCFEYQSELGRKRVRDGVVPGLLVLGGLLSRQLEAARSERSACGV